MHSQLLLLMITCCPAGAYAHVVPGSLVALSGYNGLDLQPLAAAAPNPVKPVLPRQGFMPYKWHAQQGQQACAAQQLPPGVFSLGKRSASELLPEPPRKRPHTDALA